MRKSARTQIPPLFDNDPHTHPKVVTDIVPSDLLDRIALEMRFLGVPTTREISLT